MKEDVDIIVNGYRKTVFGSRFISYVDVVILARESSFASNALKAEDNPTITYRHGPGNAEGTLTRGERLQIDDGMIFNVAVTNNA